jgi:hypothetical protein
LFSLQLWDAGLIGKSIDDVELNHEFEPPVFGDSIADLFGWDFYLPTCGDDREPRRQLSSFCDGSVCIHHQPVE